MDYSDSAKFNRTFNSWGFEDSRECNLLWNIKNCPRTKNEFEGNELNEWTTFRHEDGEEYPNLNIKTLCDGKPIVYPADTVVTPNDPDDVCLP